MNRHAEPDAKEILRRKVSQSHEPGADPYNTADTIRVSQQLSTEFINWSSLPDALSTCIWCGNAHRNPDDRRFCPDSK